MNSSIPPSPRFLVVTPVRDEQAFIARTIRSVVAQTWKPTSWIIVDDGSTDNTSQIVKQAAEQVPWITLIRTQNQARSLGSAEVIAFNRGLAGAEEASSYDFIVKLDGDLELPHNYFEAILHRMLKDDKLGICSGIYCEETDDSWNPVSMPKYHAAGASKIVRRACFEDIGGFVTQKGWDTVDEVRAGLKGWKTCHFDDVVFKHLKPEGQAMGSISTHRFHGEIYYQTGGSLLFLLAKVAHRIIKGRPIVLGGLSMLVGYLRPLIQRKPRLVSPEEASYYRSMLHARLLAALTGRNRSDRG